MQYPDFTLTNFGAEFETMVAAANTMSSKVKLNSQVILLTYAMSVLQAVSKNKLPQLQEALNTIRCLRQSCKGCYHTVKLKTIRKQTNCQRWEKTKIQKTTKSVVPVQNPYYYSYHQLTRLEQLITIRLRTGHSKVSHFYCVQHSTVEKQSRQSNMCSRTANNIRH